jgi:hypothetical protein
MILDGDLMEARQAETRRYPRKIAAWPAWVRFHSSAKYVKGRTRNVSGGGAYVVLPTRDGVAEGDELEYVLGVPAEAGDHLVIEAVNGKAHVVRVENGPDGGLALRFVEEIDIK